tara:strand:- start:121 stop:282 length:162 start_codon:yes stop_codon:yes gene_type:complete
MTELIGDVCEPSNLKIPEIAAAQASISKAGFIFISGGKLYFDTGSAIETITSS